MMRLDRAFFGRPIAHRGYHDVTAGRPENSLAAFQAAIDAGYGIECDLQLSRDGQAMVFHDYDLGRLTAETDPVRQRDAAELTEMPLLNGTAGIPTLEATLDLVAGQVPLLIELKDQDGALGPGIGVLEEATAKILAGYNGPTAVMSFNPYSTETMAKLLPDVPHGLVTCDFAREDWPLVPQKRCESLRDIPDFERLKCDFISHDRADLDRPRVAEIKNSGAAIFCWTVRSPAEESKARKIAHNITFEGYAAPKSA